MSDRVAERAFQAAAMMALAAACLALPASAELQPVGLEAQGVDVRASLRTDLDVRDVFNRPVSRTLVERQLAGGREAADPSRYVSRLPMVQALWDALNRVLLGVGLRGGRPWPRRLVPQGSPLRAPKPDPKLLAVFAALAAALLHSLRPKPAVIQAAPASGRPRILRC